VNIWLYGRILDISNLIIRGLDRGDDRREKVEGDAAALLELDWIVLEGNPCGAITAVRGRPAKLA
jgi:hypothetical protein